MNTYVPANSQHASVSRLLFYLVMTMTLCLLGLSTSAIAQPIYDVTQSPYNADPTDMNDDTTAISDAIDDIATSGTRGVLYLPAGTYYTSSSSLSPGDGVIMRGAGVGQTIISRTDASGHAIEPPVGGVEDLIIEDLTIDAAPSQGIRMAEGTNVLIQRVHVKTAGDYGIGFQVGPYKNVILRDVVVEDSGDDGIDIKNDDDNNENVILDNVTVINPGGTNKAGIDIRGPVMLSKITVKELNANQSGIRFRQGELLATNGLGAHYSILRDFRVESDSKTGTDGVEVVARNVIVDKGFISGVARGVYIQQAGTSDRTYKTTVSGVNIDDSSTGIRIDGPNVTVRDSKLSDVDDGIDIDYDLITSPAGDDLVNAAFISGVTISASSSPGDGITINAANVSVSDSYITDFTNGVSVNTGTDLANTSLMNVTVEGASSSGFNIGDSDDDVGEGTDNVRIVNSRAINGTGSGWGFRITGDNVSLIGCTATNNGTRGVRILSSGGYTAENTLVTGGYFTDNPNGGIQDQGTNTVLTDNFT